MRKASLTSIALVPVVLVLLVLGAPASRALLAPTTMTTTAVTTSMTTSPATSTTRSTIGPTTRSTPRSTSGWSTVLVRIDHPMEIRRWPGAGSVIGWMPSHSRYGAQIEAPVLQTADAGRYGKVPVPYDATNRLGWIVLRGLHRSWTTVVVHAQLSKHRLVVERDGRVIARVTAATGSPSTPTPTGDYFVTDRVPFSSGSEYGSFAFGISGIQSHLPPGWTGGDQLAIHGTNDPSSIGRSVSTGCLRVSEQALAMLEPLLRLGTPVIISP